MRAPARARRSNTGSRYGSARASTASPPRSSGRPRRRSVSRRRFRGRRATFCLGRNYMEHAAERGAEAPAHPVYFRKAPECVLAPGGKIVHHPVTQELDYEVELARRPETVETVHRAGVTPDALPPPARPSPPAQHPRPPRGET